MRDINFESEEQRFSWLVDTVTSLSQNLKGEPLLISKVEENTEFFLVTSSLLRLGISYAQGIITLIKNKQPDSTPPLHRSLYELWIEFRFLLRSKNPEQSAVDFSIKTDN